MDVIIKFIETQSFKNYEKMNRLTAPLRTHFGITTFWHYRIDANGSFFYTGNDPKSMQSYLELDLHRMCPFLTHPDFFPQVNVLFDTIHNADDLLEFKQRDCKTNLQDIYVVLRKTAPRVCEGFGFASTSSSNCITELSSQSPKIFDSFLEYYLEEAKQPLRQLYSNRVSIREFRGAAFSTKIDLHKRLQQLQQNRLHFLSTIKPKNTLSVNLLTAREKECVYYYLKGLTAKETAHLLYISKRTVETHFVHIMQKLNLTSKRQLLQKIDILSLFDSLNNIKDQTDQVLVAR